MGEEEPEAVRLQRHQGRHVRRRLRRRAGSTAFGGVGDKLEKGPYDAGDEGDAGTRRSPTSRSSTQNVVITPGNAGTLDMLNRGEIAMGPVWVDMFYTWMADGKLPPNMKLKLVAARHARPADVLRRAGEGGEREARARSSSRSPTSPEVQAEGIVKRSTGIRASTRKNLEGKLDQAAWKKLFTDISPDDLRQKGKPFPLAPYFNDILEGYERKVAN